MTGCATGDKDRILPQAGPTMKEVYQRHFSGGDLNASSASGSEAPSRPAVLNAFNQALPAFRTGSEFNAQPQMNPDLQR
jgi:hypothetical protein